MLCFRLSLVALPVMLFTGSRLRAEPVDRQALFDKVRLQVASTVQHAPRFTCMETIERSWYADRRPQQPGCDSDRPPKAVDRNLLRSDRLRLDVAVGSGQEMFSWHGEKGFRSEDIDQIVSGGPINSGTYFSFLSSIFLSGASKVFFREMRDAGGKQMALFAYSVAIGKSSFTTYTQAGKQVMGYHGEFLAEAATGRLEELEIVTDKMPEGTPICTFHLQARYSETVLGGISFQLPTEVVMDVLELNREHTRTITRYSQCQQFLGESALRFDAQPAEPAAETPAAALKKLAPHLRVDIRIKSTVNPETAWAGDVVEGELARDIVAGRGVRIAPKGTPVHGRLLRVESWQRPEKFHTVAVQFEQLSLAGKEYSLDLTKADRQVVALQSQFTKYQRVQVDNIPILDRLDAYRFRLNDEAVKLRNVITYWTTK